MNAMKGFDGAAHSAKIRARTASPLAWIGFVGVIMIVFQAVSLYSPSKTAVVFEHELRSFRDGVSLCDALALKPDSTISASRKNHRFEAGTKPTLLKNASLIDGDGTISYRTNILMEDGIFTRITDLALDEVETMKDILVYDVQGRFVTPGLVDMHSHAGVASSPTFEGTSDDNEISDPVTSQMLVIDGIDLDDLMIKRIMSGGVTSSLILPGSANVIGGEAFAIKHSAKKSLVVEDYLVQKGIDGKRQRWIKMACGENPKAVYPDKVNTRMGIGWSFRHRFDQARTLLQKQDAWCERAATGPAAVHGEPFPSDLELESMVGVLRGNVQINNHCYNKQDFEMQIRNSKEFGFEIGAFHHAHDAYRVPELLKNAPGNITIAIFATLWGYKREAFNGSPYAGKVLTDANIPVAYKSDHPVTNSQHLIYHSQLATHFDLSDQLAIKAVTSVPATSLGLGHRIGYVRPGYDADLVLWDSYPLELGAHPIQVFVDGAAQFDLNHEGLQAFVPESSVSDSNDVLDLQDTCATDSRSFIITGIKQDLTSEARAELSAEAELTLVVTDGMVSCFDQSDNCKIHSTKALSLGGRQIHVQNAVVAPGVTAVSLNLGLGEIDAEESTKDGLIDGSKPMDASTVIRAYDGLVFGGPHSDRASKMGVLTSITAPGDLGMMMGTTGDFLQGVSVAFRLAGKSILDQDAVIKKEVALHFTVGDGAKGAVGTGSESVSTQIKTLRTIFSTNTSLSNVYAQAAGGKLPVVIDVHSSDEMAHLILLKKEFPDVYMVFKGATEAYLIAKELAAAGIPVLAVPRCVPSTWRSRQCLAGPPMSEDTNLSILLRENVKVGLIPTDDGALGELYWEAAWAAKLVNESTDELQLSDHQIVALISSNVREILRLPAPAKEDLVVFSGSPLDVKSQIAVVVEGGAIRHCTPRVD